jgi:hypothetical protein
MDAFLVNLSVIGLSEKDERRFVIIRSSDDKIGKSSSLYFDELYTLMKDADTIRTIYSHFKNCDLSSYDPAMIPLTEHISRQEKN